MFGGKKRVEILRKEVIESFNNVKNDLAKVGKWIKVIDDKNNLNEKNNRELKEELKQIREDLEEVKGSIEFFGQGLSKQLSKHKQTSINKQQTVFPVQTAVQTAVQTVKIEKLTVMERAIIFALLNSEIKLSYEDLAAMFGKSKSTIRGQINNIKQKNVNLIEEYTEPNGKKRLFLPEKVKSDITKDIKVKIKREKPKKAKSES
ncbi:MAG: hypothetical protein WC260_00135 [Candidatus Pacearchaeota archaeon]